MVLPKIPEKFFSKMVKVQKLPSGQLVVTIPKVLADYEDIEKGTELEFKKHKDGFVLKIKKVNK
ncbi:MAG: hypothetical protein IH934_06555 [Nanoarchaeota archaeon]|nr:hypothetical protein [Nanoarchaeota archaeon]